MTRQRLEQAAAAKTMTNDIRPGMQLAREFGGKVHVVTIGDAGEINCNDWARRDRTRDHWDALVGSCLLRPQADKEGRKKRDRCAICTRKSSEEGPELAFNSLHASREACAAYILS